MSYVIDADGTVKDRPNGQVLAFFAQDGVIQDRRNGQVIGFLSGDGTVFDRRNGQKLGKVAPDGTVHDTYGRPVGEVSAPVFKRGALLLILG